MRKSKQPVSEAEELKAYLVSLQSHEFREIAGWDSGFPHFNRLMNGILPGLTLLVGPPSCGKTTFAKQLCDQVVLGNSVPGIFFCFAERKTDLSTRTLARLSQLENREIRKGRYFLVHWYGVPKEGLFDAESLPPGWERLERAAEEAEYWLKRLYLIEGDGKTGMGDIAADVRRIKDMHASTQAMVVIDDCQRLGEKGRSLEARLPLVTEELQSLALMENVPILAIWPELRNQEISKQGGPWEWAERSASADIILVMETDREKTKKRMEPTRAVTLHIVKNRGGERGAVCFDYYPPLAKFTETSEPPIA